MVRSVEGAPPSTAASGGPRNKLQRDSNASDHGGGSGDKWMCRGKGLHNEQGEKQGEKRVAGCPGAPRLSSASRGQSINPTRNVRDVSRFGLSRAVCVARDSKRQARRLDLMAASYARAAPAPLGDVRVGPGGCGTVQLDKGGPTSEGRPQRRPQMAQTRARRATNHARRGRSWVPRGRIARERQREAEKEAVTAWTAPHRGQGSAQQRHQLQHQLMGQGPVVMLQLGVDRLEVGGEVSARLALPQHGQHLLQQALSVVEVVRGQLEHGGTHVGCGGPRAPSTTTHPHTQTRSPRYGG